MAANSDGEAELTTVVTCEGDLSDSGFPSQLDRVVNSLSGILGGTVKVRKLEPWNSVRVTLSIPREAALRLRQLATEGSQQLRALGILSIQVEGDQVVSLRLATGAVNSEAQEILLRTSQDASTGSMGSGSTATTGGPGAGSAATSSNAGDLSSLLSGGSSSSAVTASADSAPASMGGPSPHHHVQFKSPNVVCPTDSVVPKVPPGAVAAAQASGPASTGTTTAVQQKQFAAGPFPFTSMNQAIHTNSNRDAASVSPMGVPLPPPPYPGPSGAMKAASASSGSTNGTMPAISSPLLVNLLQNDGSGATSVCGVNGGKEGIKTASATSALPMNRQQAALKAAQHHQHRVAHSMGVASVGMNVNAASVPSGLTAGVSKQHPAMPQPQASILMNNNTLSPSALSTTNTSIRQNSSSTILTSTTGVAVSSKTPPPQYHRALSNVVKQQQQQSPLATGGYAAAAVNSMGLQQTSAGMLAQQQQTAMMQNPAGGLKLPLRNQQLQKHHLGMTKVQQTASAVVGGMPKMLHNNLLGQQQHLQQPQPSLPPPLMKPATVSVQQQQQHPVHKVPLNLLQQQQSGLDPIPATATGATVSNPAASLNNVMLRSLPSPPPYSVAISRPWDSLAHSNPLMDLTPTLTDLKADELDELLPTLERELTQSPLLDLPEDFLNDHPHIISSTEEITPPEDNRKFLINPLTGEMEPQSSGESDTEETKDVFTGLPSPAALTDDDTCSTMRPDTTTDQSDSETRLSSDSSKQASSAAPSGGRIKNSKARERAREQAAAAASATGAAGKPEKIKLTLRLEKSEPVNPAYKVDVSFVNAQQPKKASATATQPGAAAAISPAGHMGAGTTSEELRVPPLHISLRGRNSVVIKNKSSKVNADGTPAMKPKARKGGPAAELGMNKSKKVDAVAAADGTPTAGGGGGVETGAGGGGGGGVGDEEALAALAMVEQIKAKTNSGLEQKKKKLKVAHDHTKDVLNTVTAAALVESELKAKFALHNHHYKEKQKERRGSDSELVRHNNKRYALDSAAVSADDKKRRLSQVEAAAAGGGGGNDDDQQPPVLGSTNVGTIAGLPQQKIRKEKDKLKQKDAFKKELNARCKVFNKTIISDKLPMGGMNKTTTAMVALPVAGEMDMEAKFKQGLLEGSNAVGAIGNVTTGDKGDKGVPRPPHRTPNTATEIVNRIGGGGVGQQEGGGAGRIDVNEKALKKSTDASVVPVDSSPGATTVATSRPCPGGGDGEEPDKCNTPPVADSGGGGNNGDKATVSEKAGGEIVTAAVVGEAGAGDKASTTAGAVTAATAAGRTSPSGGNSTSSGQGEDSGIESMDALSEKSPNQASQSPHTDLLATAATKTQVPNMLDIEAQLAKMEGLNGSGDVTDEADRRLEANVSEHRGPPQEEDVNENHNKSHHDRSDKLTQCCELTCALQDSLKKNSGLLSTSNVKQQSDSLVPSKGKREDDELEPLPVRVTPALYTYSNPEKNSSRVGSESPGALSDEDSNSCSTNSSTLPGKQGKSLLEQLLIEIPNDHSVNNGSGGGTGSTTAAPSPATRSSVRTRALSKLNSPSDEQPPNVQLASPPITAARPARSATGTTANNAGTQPATTGQQQQQQQHAAAQPAATAKRKRNESDSSSAAGDDASTVGGATTGERKKKVARKTKETEEHHQQGVKTRHHEGAAGAGGGGTTAIKNSANALKKTAPKVQSIPHEDSSDSDEPLMDKLRKPLQNNSTAGGVKAKTPSGVATPVPTVNNNKVADVGVHNTRRSVRGNAAAAAAAAAAIAAAPNTRSKGERLLQQQTEAAMAAAAAAAAATHTADNAHQQQVAVAATVQTAAAAVRRKTRSAVSDVENKRKKEVK